MHSLRRWKQALGKLEVYHQQERVAVELVGWVQGVVVEPDGGLPLWDFVDGVAKGRC